MQLLLDPLCRINILLLHYGYSFRDLCKYILGILCHSCILPLCVVGPGGCETCPTLTTRMRQACNKKLETKNIWIETLKPRYANDDDT